jgi:hypothetical protein
MLSWWGCGVNFRGFEGPSSGSGTTSATGVLLPELVLSILKRFSEIPKKILQKAVA